ncbi:uncharacterized protein EDB91DRAFT_1067226, partial [Suillus paluster]|uniref:uncharacterized protein n=1 Tax=Suillus paluster TaxID=48578 RepID=UPI001B85CC36
KWLAALTTSEFLWNSITAAVAPELFESGFSAFSKVVKEVRRQKNNSAPVDSWPSIFSGLEIIANRTTFSHRDPGGSPSLFDLLVSLGRNHHATLSLADVHAELDYSPGAMVYIAGRVLEHSVGPWINGERIVVAHFMKDAVHDRVKVPRPSFPMQRNFLELIGRKPKHTGRRANKLQI